MAFINIYSAKSLLWILTDFCFSCYDILFSLTLSYETYRTIIIRLDTGCQCSYVQLSLSSFHHDPVFSQLIALSVIAMHPLL